MHTINSASALPGITQPVVIDGYSQQGSSLNTLAVGDNATLQIELNGSGGVGTSAAGLTLTGTGGNSTVRGLVINRFGAGGISILSGNNTVAGNFIGTDAVGGSVFANARQGVVVEGSNNVIGGPTIEEKNIISGNNNAIGVYFSGPGAAGNVVQGNYIGTNAAGTAALGNSAGIFINNGAPNNTIAGNVISGNLNAAISIQDSPGTVKVRQRLGYQRHRQRRLSKRLWDLHHKLAEHGDQRQRHRQQYLDGGPDRLRHRQPSEPEFDLWQWPVGDRSGHRRRDRERLRRQ